MSAIRRTLTRSTLPVLLVLCLAALSVSYAFADEAQRPLATQIIGDPDAAVTGKFAVGTATPGNKALTVIGVIDFLGAGTVHNYFTQGTGNNMQINTNVDEANVVGDATKSQWKLVMGSSLDWFSIRRSPAGGMYSEDALFFIEGSTGNVGIATVNTGNSAAIPFAPRARLHVETSSGDAVLGLSTDSSGLSVGVTGQAWATTGFATGVYGQSSSPDGTGVVGRANATSGGNIGVYGRSDSVNGYGMYGEAVATSGLNWGVYGQSNSPDGYGVYGSAPSYGVFGVAYATGGLGVVGRSESTDGRGVFGIAATTSGTNAGVYGRTYSPSGYGLYTPNDARVEGTLFLGGSTSGAVCSGDASGDQELRLVRGRVAGNGTISGGTGFTVNRTGVGVYSLTFSPAFNAGPSLAVTASDVSNLYIASSGGLCGSSACTIKTFNLSGSLVDSSFTFIAAGPR